MSSYCLLYPESSPLYALSRAIENEHRAISTAMTKQMIAFAPLPMRDIGVRMHDEDGRKSQMHSSNAAHMRMPIQICAKLSSIMAS